MGQDKDSTVSIFLVFGVIIVGAIALFARIREQRLHKAERLDRSGANNVKFTNVTLSLVGMEARGKAVQYRRIDW